MHSLGCLVPRPSRAWALCNICSGKCKSIGILDQEFNKSVQLDTVYSIQVITSMTPVTSTGPPMAGNELNAATEREH